MIGAQVFSRRGVEKDERAQAIEEAEIERLRKDQEDEVRIIRDSSLRKVRELMDRQGLPHGVPGGQKRPPAVRRGVQVRDTLYGSGYRHGDIAIDDLVGIFNAGAYGYSMSPQMFLSHPSPVEVLVLDGEIIEARRRGTYEDLLLKQNPLPGTA